MPGIDTRLTLPRNDPRTRSSGRFPGQADLSLLIFKRLILALAGLFVLATLYVMLTAPGGTVVDEGSVDLASQDVIQRGEYLATAGNCGSCHTARGGEFMAGGLPFETPFGTIYSTNITGDSDTGIGARTAGEFLD